MTEISIKKLVAFAVLMQTGPGITSKSPGYILEKWDLVKNCPEKLLITLMDPNNQRIFEEWLRVWGIRRGPGDVHDQA